MLEHLDHSSDYDRLTRIKTDQSKQGNQQERIGKNEGKRRFEQRCFMSFDV